MMSIIMFLIALTVLWENVTSLPRGGCFWESWTDTRYPDSAGGSSLENGNVFGHQNMTEV